MKSSQKVVRLIGFSDIFHSNDKKQLGEYLGGINRNVIIQACTHFLTFKYSDPVHTNIPELIGLFLSPLNKNLANKIGPKFENIAKKREVRLLNNLALLEILEYALKEVDKSTAFNEQQIEENFLKALLLVNDNIINRQKRASETVGDVDGISKGAYLMMTGLIPYADIDNLNLKELLNSQIIRTIKLFKFLNVEPKLQLIYSEFLKHFDAQCYQEYLLAYLSIPFNIVSFSKKGRFEIDISSEPDKETILKLLEQFSINTTEEFSQDFLQIRDAPLYKTSNESFTVLYGVFAIEKVFKSVYFKLNQINNSLEKGLQINNFKSEYCDKFSEQIIFYDAISQIFKKIPDKHAGRDILKRFPDFSGEPDFFVKRELKRGKSNLLIFESKDVLINADTKVSFDFQLYAEELKKKFHSEIITKPNGKIKTKPKAILQITNNIKRILLKQLPFEKKYHRRKISIYPILVVHNNQLDVPGVNYLLNEWFFGEMDNLRKELKHLGYLVNKVKPLVLINIDTLLFFQDAFQSKHLEKAIDEYYYFLKYPSILKRLGFNVPEDLITQSYETFSSFCSNYMAERKIKNSPKELLSLSTSLFEQ